jgi:hypothetical protein
MGIRLAMEAADRTAEDYTWRERCVLMVFAMSAIDDTRECPPGIEDRPEIIRRLGLSRTQRYAVIASLVDKGALERRERGRNGVKAHYAIADSVVIIPGAGRPGDPDARPVDNHVKHPSNRDPSEVLKGPGSENEGSRKPGLKHPSNRDPSEGDTVFLGIKGFKTGGGTPPPPGRRPLFPFALPDVPPEEGDIPMAKNPAANGTGGERQALAAEICKSRSDWSARSVLRALEKPDVAERPWLLVCEALRIMAADPATQHAGRLEYDGPWWPEAARKLGTVSAARQRWCGKCHEGTRMRETDDNRAVRCPDCGQRAAS